MSTIVVCSGGLDSVTLAYKVKAELELAGLISFDYGQRHKKELEFAKQCAHDLGVTHQIIDISDVGSKLTGSALTDNIDVPDGHYEEDSMKTTIVPNRNAIMLTIAYGVATSMGADAVAIAVHGGDHFIYPDCRPEFIDAFVKMQSHALDGVANIEMYAPFLNGSKAEIAREAIRLNIPVEKTWSCYKGGERHCGKCGTCVERIEAFSLAKETDPTEYEDTSFWKEKCNGE